MMKFYDSFGNEHELPVGKSYIWRPSAYALVENGSRILFVRDKNHGKLELPGGGINLGEPILEGVVREVFEETGYTIKVPVPNPFYTREKFFYARGRDEYWHAILMYFKADLASEHQETGNIDNQEIVEVVWLSLQEIEPSSVTQTSKEAIEQVSGF